MSISRLSDRVYPALETMLLVEDAGEFPAEVEFSGLTESLEECDEAASLGREARAAATGSASRALDQLHAEILLDLAHLAPRAPVRELHAVRRLGERACLLDECEQADAVVAEDELAVLFHPELDSRFHVGSVSPRRHKRNPLGRRRSATRRGR